MDEYMKGTNGTEEPQVNADRDGWMDGLLMQLMHVYDYVYMVM